MSIQQQRAVAIAEADEASRRKVRAHSDVILNHALVAARTALTAVLTWVLEQRRDAGYVISHRNEEITREIAKLARRIDRAVNGASPSN